MAYDEKLADRIREALAGTPSLEEKKMFGGLCFLVRGHMACGIAKGELMVRVGAEGYEAALARPHAKEMTFTGKPIKTMVYVDPDGFRTKKQLGGWIAMGVAHAEGLPPKSPKAPRKKTPKKRA
ncbi:MAG: TfoX/Sxy family protein [Sandaracinaceae bacterium]|nr:TfoX/Sxy family protein [Sandaracinaceae bacterium]